MAFQLERNELGEDELIELPLAFCPTCDGPGDELGRLGPLFWYRCRNCGIDFSTPVAADDRYRNENGQ